MDLINPVIASKSVGLEKTANDCFLDEIHALEMSKNRKIIANSVEALIRFFGCLQQCKFGSEPCLHPILTILILKFNEKSSKTVTETHRNFVAPLNQDGTQHSCGISSHRSPRSDIPQVLTPLHTTPIFISLLPGHASVCLKQKKLNNAKVQRKFRHSSVNLWSKVTIRDRVSVL